MPDITAWGTRCLACVVLMSSAALAQRAPVPRQVLDARTVFVGNGGSESYGADSYFRLTRYDGGPNRPYSEFYGALKDWGHYDLVGSTTDADLLLVIRFTNPIVDRDPNGNKYENVLVYDPQLSLTMNDPKTGVMLWTITEHIEPGGNNREANNRHFDEAIDRLVGDLKRLNLGLAEVISDRETIALPPGAIAAAERERREMHAGTGMLLGGAVGAIVAWRTNRGPCEGFNACVARSRVQARTGVLTTIGGMVAGALIGWVWPVHF